MMITTRQLRYFDALARFGHFGKAAEFCAVSQPALSMQIAEMELHLGVTLVERRAKGFTLTDVGREIARRGASILLEMNNLSDYAASCKLPLALPIPFGLIPTIAPYLLAQLLHRAEVRHPGLELHIREAQTHLLIDELLNGTLDLLLLALPVHHSELETRALHDDRFWLVAPPGRNFSPNLRISPELIENDRLLLLEEGHCLRDQALAVCKLLPEKRFEMFGASSLATVVQMVAHGQGLTLLPESSIARETAGLDIQLLRFVDPEPKRTLGIAWRKTSPRKADFAELGSLIEQALASLIRS